MFAGITAEHKKSSSGQFDCKGKTVSRIQHLVQIVEGKGVTAEQVQAHIEKTKQQQKPAKAAFGKGPFAGGGSMDLVVTWLNSSDPRWIKVANAEGGTLQDVELDFGYAQTVPYNPKKLNLAGNFLELKYWCAAANTSS